MRSCWEREMGSGLNKSMSKNHDFDSSAGEFDWILLFDCI